MAISVGVASVAIGIGIPVFYESQINNASKRDNTQPCFPCSGSGARKFNLLVSSICMSIVNCNESESSWSFNLIAEQCRFCLGKGKVEVTLGGGVDEVSLCINCDGAGSLTCTTCQGSGIQPRYLDRREFKDDDDWVIDWWRLKFTFIFAFAFQIPPSPLSVTLNSDHSLSIYIIKRWNEWHKTIQTFRFA